MLRRSPWGSRYRARRARESGSRDEACRRGPDGDRYLRDATAAIGQDVRVLMTTVPLWEIIARTAAVYIAVLGLLRLGGKRELGQMTPADFVVVLILANAVQNAMNGGDVSLTGGIVSAATLLGMNYGLGRLGRAVPFLGRLFLVEPTLLLQDGKLITEALDRE